MTTAVAAAGGGSGSVIGIALADLALIVVVAYVFVRLARRVRQPAVLGEIVAGIALGPSLLGLLPGDLPDLIFPAEVRPFLSELAQLGLVLFMFGVGYHLDLARLRGSGGQVAVVSLGSVVLPFALGAGLAFLMFPWLDHGQLSTSTVLGPALFLGAAMSITAFPVLARIIAERGQQGRLGALALASAAVQDLLAWCVLAVVVAVVTADGAAGMALTIGGSLVFVAAQVLLVRPAMSWLLAPGRRWARTPLAGHALLVSGLLVSAWASDLIGLHVVFGAFLFGAILPRRRVAETAPEVPGRIEQTSALLLPVFFTVTGLSVDLTGLDARGGLMLALVLAVACASKFAGAAGAARATGLDGRRSAVLGVLLNARGLTELIILDIGLELGMLDQRLYTVMIAMALLTTVIAGPLSERLSRGRSPRANRRRAPAVAAVAAS